MTSRPAARPRAAREYHLGVRHDDAAAGETKNYFEPDHNSTDIPIELVRL